VWVSWSLFVGSEIVWALWKSDARGVFDPVAGTKVVMADPFLVNV
jgi:hypothetical protein